MPVWKLVHILGMFGAFGLLLVPLYLLLGMARAGDVHAARATYAMGKTLGRIAFGLFLVGLAGGFAAMVTGGWSGTSPWLMATYALLALVTVLETAVMNPWRRRVERAFDRTGPGSAPPSDLVALLRGPQPVLYAWAATVALAAIVSLMVLKPSFGI